MIQTHFLKIDLIIVNLPTNVQYSTKHFLTTKHSKKEEKHFSRTLDCVIPAWSAGIYVDMDVSGASCESGYRQSMPV